jgi:hypothetical protein
MDANRFDTLSRFLATATPRRETLRLLSSVVLGASLLYLDKGDIGAKRKKKKKKKAKVTVCVNGQSLTVPKSVALSLIEQGATYGACALPPCQGLANDAPCNGDGRCLAGVCNPRPDCDPVGTPCSPAGPNTACCSDVCFEILFGPVVCDNGTPNTRCFGAGQCFPPLQCVGYRCI